jgi:hypothetical protein
MSDVLPKMKMYILVSIVSLVINLGVILSSLKFDFGSIALGLAGSFIPVISLISVAISGLPTEIMVFVAIVTGLLTGIQVFILAMIVLSLVKNIFWQPDV